MPSEKRARQRAMRELKAEEQSRRDRRSRRIRRGGVVAVVAAIIVGIIFAVSGGSNNKAASGKTSTTTTSPGSSTTSSTSATTTTIATKLAAGCPPVAGATKRTTTFTQAPPDCIAKNGVFDATITTDVGTFVMKMTAASSYAAVNNFVFLARNHYFDGIIFHRVIPGFVVQGGDPTGTGSGGPGYSFTGNTPPAACGSSSTCYPLGAVAMANSSGPSSDGSQFFVVVGASGEQLPPSYTLFGHVTSGMAVVDKIAADGTSGGTPKVTHHMVKVTITQLAS